MAFYNEILNNSNFIISFANSPKYDFAIFAKGYYLAANNIAESLLSRRSFRDYEAYPVVFLYRQSLELHLKNIIYKYALLCAFNRTQTLYDKLENTHNLEKLSNKVMRILGQAFPDDTSLNIFLGNLNTISSEFTTIDPLSYAFRYPINTQGGSSTSPHLCLNLEAIYSSMKSLIEGLEAIDVGLNIATDAAQEAFELLETMVE